MNEERTHQDDSTLMIMMLCTIANDSSLHNRLLYADALSAFYEHLNYYFTIQINFVAYHPMQVSTIHIRLLCIFFHVRIAEKNITLK